MPVVRNQQYYFREGFCWSNVLTTYIKCRLKQKTVHSTESMSFFSAIDTIPESYMISLINSRFIAYYIDSFVNSTSHCTTGDAKLIPILVPTKDQIDYLEAIFDRALKIKKKEVASEISEEKAKELLNEVQNDLDEFVYTAYNL